MHSFVAHRSKLSQTEEDSSQSQAQYEPGRADPEHPSTSHTGCPAPVRNYPPSLAVHLCVAFLDRSRKHLDFSSQKCALGDASMEMPYGHSPTRTSPKSELQRRQAHASTRLHRARSIPSLLFCNTQQARCECRLMFMSSDGDLTNMRQHSNAPRGHYVQLWRAQAPTVYPMAPLNRLSKQKLGALVGSQLRGI